MGVQLGALMRNLVVAEDAMLLGQTSVSGVERESSVGGESAVGDVRLWVGERGREVVVDREEREEDGCCHNGGDVVERERRVGGDLSRRGAEYAVGGGPVARVKLIHSHSPICNPRRALPVNIAVFHTAEITSLTQQGLQRFTGLRRIRPRRTGGYLFVGTMDLTVSLDKKISLLVRSQSSHCQTVGTLCQ